MNGGWRLFSDNEALGIRTWHLVLDNGDTVVRKDHYVTEALLDANAERRAATSGQKWGDGALVASIPMNVLYSELMPAIKNGDDKFIDRWLNDGDHAKFRTKEGRV